MRILLPTLALLSLAACATNSGQNSVLAEYDRLVQDCRERGGILAPTGRTTGRPETENVCRVTGLPSDRTSR